jgi:hypothetical protein
MEGRLGGWVAGLGLRWRGWRKKRKGRKVETVTSKPKEQEDEDTRSENDSAYESLPGSARVGGPAEEGEGRDMSRDSLTSEESVKGAGGWGGGDRDTPPGIIKPPLLGDPVRPAGGGEGPKKKVSFPERDVSGEGRVRVSGEGRVRVRREARRREGSRWREEGEGRWREVTRYTEGSRSVAAQLEAIKQETRAWLQENFPR